MEHVKLKKLFKGIPLEKVKGSLEVEIRGLCSHSKMVTPGDLYIAKKGVTTHGAEFIFDAVSAGAVAVLTDVYDPFLEGVVQLIHRDVSQIEKIIAQRYYMAPDHSLLMVGVTGTNGKTTTSYLIKHLLDNIDIPSGLVGTVESILGKTSRPTALTTSDLITNYKLLQEMVFNGCKGAVLEVSSHALDQERMGKIAFDIGVFTNLTPEHLDYHKTLEAYAEAKGKLFTSITVSADKPFPKCAIVNLDDPWVDTILKGYSGEQISYSIDKMGDVRASNLSFSEKGVKGIISYEGKEFPFTSRLVGRFNVYNFLAALCSGVALSIPMQQALEILSRFKNVPGRLERVANKKNLSIFIDYAHTQDALKNVLETLREFQRGKIITVFGCGGDRDFLKRPLMGKVAEELSDIVIVTTDNPRSENPQKIIKEIMGGITPSSQVFIEPNREKAIHLAVRLATKNDFILIAGKGHETSQIFAHQTIPFDDREVVQEICAFKE